MINCFFDHHYATPEQIVVHLNEGNNKEELSRAISRLSEISGLSEIYPVLPGKKWVLTRRAGVRDGVLWHKGLFDDILAALGHPRNQRRVA